MSKKITFCILLALLQNISFASTFIPISIDKQVEEATSAIEANLESVKVFKNDSGMIMSEYSFDVIESFNTTDYDLVHKKIKLSLPGGTYNGISSMIDGAPQFAKDEKVFLLLKNINSKNYLSNFSLGKFKIQEIDGKVFYVSEVFFSNPVIGKISKDKMLELMKNKWKMTDFEPKNSPSRVIASGSILKKSPFTPVGREVYKNSMNPFWKEESKAREGVPVFFWGAVVFFIFFFGLIFMKLEKNGIEYKNK